MTDKTQKEIKKEMELVISRVHTPDWSRSWSDHFWTEYAVVRSPGRGIDEVTYELGQREIEKIGRVGGGSTRLTNETFDSSGNFGAFQTNVYYQGLVPMIGIVYTNKDIIYTIARKGDLFEARLLTSSICKSGAEGDTTEHHSFRLKSIGEEGVLNYVQRVRTEFDYSRQTMYGINPRATKIEEFNITHRIQVPNMEEIEKLKNFGMK